MSFSRDESAADLRGNYENDPAVRHRWTAIAAILGAMVLAVLDAAIANLALPVLARDLNVTAASSIWVVTSYQLALVMSLLPAAALGESIGYRRVFAGGVAIFTVASMFCAWAPSFQWLVASRFVQGLGAAAIMALGVALLRIIVPQQKLGAAIGWNALAVALSTAAGPTIGAAILAVGTWQLLFAFKIPLGIVVLLAARDLPETNATGRLPDAASVVLNAAGLALLVMSVNFLATQPWIAGASFVASGLSLILLVRRESLRVAPLFPLDLLRVPPFRLAVVSSVLCFSGQTAGLVALPFYLQHMLGQSVLSTGLYMTVWPLTVALAAPVVGHLANRVAASWLCALGGTLLAMGLGAAAIWPLYMNLTPLVPFMVLCGLGFGLFNVPNNRTMLLQAPRARSGAAGGMQGTARLLGQTAGALAVTLLFTLVETDAAPRIALALGAALTLAASAVAVLRQKHGAS